MTTRTLALAACFALALTGAALAQTPAGGGSAEGNVNNPGSIKSNSEKAMERSTGSATMPGATTGSTTANPAMVPPGAGPAGTGMAPGTGGTAGGPAGTNR
ncbi:MAG: hypothetical protein K2Y56_00500 [Methylobacterium sp.]|uniref:hypothetical protein n=1 Tax=Methylobacterium sp. TaxID=409 RepID=UPI0025CE716E|nr:hypothetical protein [Methylobacterium sp.]MBX9930018.1 hypothetical protein [Methylobacterium sp.]